MKVRNAPPATHEPARNPNGTLTLRHLASGETMHSRVGPAEEARLLYIEQSRLRDRLLASGAEGEELVLFDVGMGAATNALAAIDLALTLTTDPARHRRLQVISFESDPSGLELALRLRAELPFLVRHADVAETLLARGHWKSAGDQVRWELKAGNFLEHVRDCPAPELVYFDLYSPKVSPELWTAEVFRTLRHERTRLFTYSSATHVREALLNAGFFVGYGCSTPAKKETTQAAGCLDALIRPLGPEWLEKLSRAGRAEARERLSLHPQFAITTLNAPYSC